ncbi:TetR/AcrR family transcriptional regulator [Nonomuraea phyllanthi]|uniref:TetR/AcrR family transcriptional regulator n=1 Tax=Nonomuraea phyllanthi TaxID=2219224 RepID=UPI001292E8B1|nr:TetR/AcrR family transcriptional regulator [Nonomuraea phyllanthi]QFY10801.1 TetR/AcrR family transcriptional regulator [Nonomuraea phyllanthi]
MSPSRPDPAAPRPDTEEPPSPLVWDRPPPDRRRAPLTREIIVSAAIPIADSEGLAALTVRRLAAELDARPMSVYSYARITSKEELFDLMTDQVCAEMIVDDLPGDWREALRAIAVRVREVLLRHPWWVELIGHNVLIGPNGTRHREQTLAALSGLRLDPSTKLAVIVAVETYVVGQATFVMDEEGSPSVPGRTAEQEALAQYQASLIATGAFPHLAGIGPVQPIPVRDRERYFLLGLDWLLSGIAVTVESPPDDAASS